MQHHENLNRLREELVQVARNIEASSAMRATDLPRLAEGLVLGLLKTVLDLPHLQRLNNPATPDYPAIDLADPVAGVAVQVTASSDIGKVKSTLDTFLRHRLENYYDRLIIYVLTQRQGRYRQSSIDEIVRGRFAFSVERDILDYRDLLQRAANSDPAVTRSALAVVRDYQRGGAPPGLLAEDADPPADIEPTTLNLVELYLPSRLYVADLEQTNSGRSSRSNPRSRVREHLKELGRTPPSDFQIHGNQLLTFRDLDRTSHPFEPITDPGTVTAIEPDEWYRIDDDHERVFKSLLRFTLQEKLFRHDVRWIHTDHLFAFMPVNDQDARQEVWTGKKASRRTVYQRITRRDDSTRTFRQRHLAFSVEFFRDGDGWYVAITPDWYFSFGPDYKRSRFSADQASWIKRQENNRQLFDQFRFLVYWLSNLDTEDLFKYITEQSPTLSFGDPVSFSNHPRLPDTAWRPTQDIADPDSDDFDGGASGSLWN